MKFDKNLAIILILGSMLISALLFAYYLYNQNKKTVAKSNQQIVTFIAKEDLEKNHIIKEEDLLQTSIAKQYLLNNPLTKDEIIGKITNEKIYKNEIFIKQKLTTKIEEEKKLLLPFDYNSYNISFKLFQNPNYTLKADDRINIISVYAKEGTKIKKDETNKFDVQYIANSVKVLGFIRDGKASDITLEKKVIKKIEQKKVIEEEVEIKADEIVLDIPNKVLLALIDDYNKGKQLWMSKTKEAQTKTVETKVLNSSKKVVQKSYPIRWYKPIVDTKFKKAIIEYIDNPDLKSVNSKKVVNNKSYNCESKDKLLIVTSTKANIRDKNSLASSIERQVSKNYVIPYVKKVDENWYMTCDENYIHKNTVKETSEKELKVK